MCFALRPVGPTDDLYCGVRLPTDMDLKLYDVQGHPAVFRDSEPEYARRAFGDTNDWPVLCTTCMWPASANSPT